MMKCKKCGGELEHYEDCMTDFNLKDGTMLIEEIWFCMECDEDHRLEIKGKIQTVEVS